MNFDPYHKWLGIPSSEQPPNHYRLLAIALFEHDPDIIETAADLRMSHLHTYQTGPHSALSQKLLNEVAGAKLCLLDSSRKSAYDAELRNRTDVARPPIPVAPMATSSVPVSVRAVALMPPTVAEQRIAYPSSPRGAAAPEGGNQWAPSALDIKIQPADHNIRVKTDRRWLALAGTAGIALGFLLAWFVIAGSSGLAPTEVASKGEWSEDGRSTKRPSGKNEPGVSLHKEFIEIFRSIERPSHLGVTADKLVIWNTHNGPANERGALKCNVRLLAGDREVWSTTGVSMPWAPNEDLSLTIVLPKKRFERVRVEITEWEKTSGGLAEIQVLAADGRNLAIGQPAMASGAWSDRFGPERVTDGVTTSADAEAGYWVLPDTLPGWVEVDCSLPRPANLAGVSAEKLVLWNQHNGPHNNSATQWCNVRLERDGRPVWRQERRDLPWSPGEDSSIEFKLPRTLFDRLRVDVTPPEGKWAGLSEVQIVRGGVNIAMNCPVASNSAFDLRRNESRVTDGIVSSCAENTGYWIAANQKPASVELDLACLDPEFGVACRQLGLALALIDGDWLRGLLWLARGDNRELRRIAQIDRQDMYDTPEQLALADAWWDLAQQAEGEIRKRLLARSLWRYRQALSKLHEFRKTQVQARLDEALPVLPERFYLFFMSESELKLDYGRFRELPVVVRGQRSPYGLFMHAISNDSAHAAFHLGKRYRRFVGAAAINDTGWNRSATALTFRILGDGRPMWNSSPLKESGASAAFDLDIEGIDKLELFVDCPGSNHYCQSVWIEPRCER